MAFKQQIIKNLISLKNVLNVQYCGVRLNATLVDKIVLTDDKTTIVAWHPKKDFPYECTRPLPETKSEDNGSLLKTLNSKSIFKSTSPEVARQELMRITYTTKHRWFPKARSKKAKKTPMDREYL